MEVTFLCEQTAQSAADVAAKTAPPENPGAVFLDTPPLLCYTETNNTKGGECMPHGYKREYNDILYFKKDHFCPDCKTKLEKVPVSKVVNSRSPEAKDFDFSTGGDTYAVGDIQFTWDEFECPNCKKHLTVNEMKEIEGIPLPKKPSKWRKILFYVFGILFLIAVALLKKYL